MKTYVLFLLLFFSVSSTSAQVTAQQKAGEIIKKTGVVKVFKGGGIRGKRVNKIGFPLHVKDTVKTNKNSNAFILFIDNSTTVLKENSALEIKGINNVGVKNGKVIFNIKKQKGVKGILVSTNSVVIGVKGTKFMVDSSGDKLEVFLKEGVLNIKSMKGEFARYKKLEMMAFDAYQKKELGDYEEYKREMEKEFKEYVKDFDLAAGGAISIDGNEVRNREIPPEVEEDFRLLDKFDSAESDRNKSFDEYENDSSHEKPIEKELKEPEQRQPATPDEESFDDLENEDFNSNTDLEDF